MKIFTLILFACLLQIIPAEAQKKLIKPIAGVLSKTIVSDGISRSYDLYLPKNIKAPVPLVVMLHGGGGNSREAAYSTQWIAKARKEGFAVALPNGLRPDTTKPASFGKNGQTWNDGSGRGLYAAEKDIDDIDFIRSMIAELCETSLIDRKRIYATGFSNGASMAFRLGVECSDLFAAIAPVSGSLWLENPSIKNAVSLLYITGDSDPLNPYHGGEVKINHRSFGVKKPVNDLLSQWITLLDASSDTSYYNGPVHTRKYKSRNSEIVCLTIKGMGHHWPGGNETLPKWLVGNPSNAINATNEIWSFFLNHPKP